MPDQEDRDLQLPNDRWLPPGGVAEVISNSSGCCLLEAIGCLFFSGLAATFAALVGLALGVVI